jgi:hypothetical protein
MKVLPGLVFMAPLLAEKRCSGFPKNNPVRSLLAFAILFIALNSAFKIINNILFRAFFPNLF